MEIFLKAKHWQLFLLTFGIPFLFQIGLMITMFSNIMSSNGAPDPMEMFSYMKWFPLMILVFAGIQYGWFWSVAMGLQKKVPEGVTMKVKKFQVFFFIPMTYLLLIMGVVFMAFNGKISIDPGTNPGVFLVGFLIVFPLHIFSMFCTFYILYFVAKTIKTVELQKEVSFGDFIGEFVLVWFFFVGVWLLQPKINKIIEAPEDLNGFVKI